jgi:dihydrofolate reductase
MVASVFVGTSLDGFIARANGTFDFLPPDGGEQHGFEEFLASVDAIVMGRNTFGTVSRRAHTQGCCKSPPVISIPRAGQKRRTHEPIKHLSVCDSLAGVRGS